MTTSAPASFLGKRKRTAALATNIQQAEDDFEGTLKKKFKAASTITTTTPCPTPPAWGTGPEQATYTNITSVQAITPATRTRAEKKKLKDESEALGEMACEHFLQNKLSAAGLPYDPNGMHTFSASGVFNKVYLWPPPSTATPSTYTPDVVIVMEGKGGTSQCGSRKSTLYKGTVQQGEDKYLHTVGDLMAKSNYRSRSKKAGDLAERDRRRTVGKAVLDARKNNNAIYVGVRGGYNDKGAFDPEVIFSSQ